VIRAIARFGVAAFVLLTLGCSAPPAPLTHEAYVWQRAWTPSLRVVLGEARGSFAAYRILALHTDRRGALQNIAVEKNAISAAKLPVIAVVRLDGGDADVATATLVPALLDVVAQWRAAGIVVNGVEIDHDCAVSKLPAYAQQLQALRGALPGDLRLSITALPAWIPSNDVSAVLDAVDEAVLQVHSVSNPALGLFDVDRAARWVREFAAKNRKPFRVAVPDYGSRVSFDDDDKPLSVESEMPLATAAARAEEMRASPADVTRLLAALTASRPQNLLGIVWFRLPLPEDKRTWSLRTLQAVVAGRSLQPEIDVLQRHADGGATDLLFANRGEIDAPIPGQLRVTARHCSAADALAGFAVVARDDGWQFHHDGKEILRAGRERAVGWVHCGQVDKVEWNADP